MIKIAPSILSADFINLGRDIDSISNADIIHFDVMDGLFVPNLSFGLPVLKAVRAYTDMEIDAHLMIERPIRYVEGFCRAGADIVTIHVEADNISEISRAIDIIRARGKKAGLAIKPGTGVGAIAPFLSRLNQVLCMTVEPGFGGQSLRMDVLPKVREVRKMITDYEYDCDVAVDGGVNRITGKLCAEAGANVLVNGTGIFEAKDRGTYIEELRGELSPYFDI